MNNNNKKTSSEKKILCIIHFLLSTSLTWALNQFPIGDQYCAWIILHEQPIVIQNFFQFH